MILQCSGCLILCWKPALLSILREGTRSPSLGERVNLADYSVELPAKGQDGGGRFNRLEMIVRNRGRSRGQSFGTADTLRRAGSH